MIQTKYLIIIAVVVCMLILYYFYYEIIKTKKLFAPLYQKTMALESRVIELEKKNIETKKRIEKDKVDSSAMTITYQSDMVKNGNLSIRYADVSESEADKIIAQTAESKQVAVLQPIARQPNAQTNLQSNLQSNVQSGDLSDCTPKAANANLQKNLHYPQIELKNNGLSETSDTFNFKLDGLIKTNSDQAEYQNILDGLSRNISQIRTEEGNTELDQDIIKSITESIQYADMPSAEDFDLSDIPKTKKTVKTPKPPKISKPNKPPVKRPVGRPPKNSQNRAK